MNEIKAKIDEAAWIEEQPKTVEEAAIKQVHEHVKTLASYVEDKTPKAFFRRVRIFFFGICAGLLLVGLVMLLLHYLKPAKYVTYITFYIQEAKGIRPASLLYPGKIETTADLEAVESMLLKKYDNGKIENIMLFGTPIVLRKIDDPTP